MSIHGCKALLTNLQLIRFYDFATDHSHFERFSFCTNAFKALLKCTSKWWKLHGCGKNCAWNINRYLGWNWQSSRGIQQCYIAQIYFNNDSYHLSKVSKLIFFKVMRSYSKYQLVFDIISSAGLFYVIG